MFFDIAIDWFFCPDGAEIYEPSADELKQLPEWVKESEMQDMFEADFRSPGPRIRYKSDRLEKRSIRTFNYRDTLFLKFASARTDKQLVEFVSTYGFPGQDTLAVWARRREGEHSDMWKVIGDEFRKEYQSPGFLLKEIRGYQKNILDIARLNSLEQFARKFGIGMEMYMPVPERGQQPRLTVRPDSIIEYMELEAALIACGNTEVQTCIHCNAYFATGGQQAKRADSKYCSPRCRVAAHRAAKKLKLRKRKSVRKGK